MVHLLVYFMCLSLNLYAEDASDSLGNEKDFKDELVEKSPSGDNTNAKDDDGPSTEREPSAIINGVNVISGNYSCSDTDFALPGGEPFIWNRSYNSSEVPAKDEGAGKPKFAVHKPLGIGWGRNYFAYLKRWKDTEYLMPYFATVGEEYGSEYTFRAEKQYDYEVSTRYHDGVVNCNGGAISAHSDITNAKLLHLKHATETTFIKPSGAKLIFTKKKSQQNWRFSSEKLTNGNERAYTYDDKHRPQDITAKDRNGNLLANLNFTYAEHTDGTKVTYLNSEKGNLLRYRFEDFRGKKSKKDFYLIEVLRNQAPTVTYSYEDHSDGAETVKMRRKDLPNNRFQEVEYYRKGHNTLLDSDVRIKESKDPRIGRVKLLKAPVGSDATPIVTSRYLYQFKLREKKLFQTDVYDALNHLSTFEWNDEYRLKVISRYMGTSDHSLYHSEKLYWGESETMACTRLKARTLEDPQGNIAFMRSFDYDYFGNVINNKLWGNLSGTCVQPCQMHKDGELDEGSLECFIDSYTYSDDDLRLMTSHTKGGISEHFFYLPNTDLLVKKLYKHRDVIYKREFYTYAACGVAKTEIEDDGSSHDRDDLTGVTERRIRRIQLNQKAPYGLPEVITEKYLAENGREAQFKKTIHSYNDDGRLIKKKIYDSDDRFVCSQSFEYDRFGNVTREKDPLGNDTIRRYDENCNKIYEQGPNSAFHTEYVYDFSNRLIKVIEIHSDGVNLEQSFRYDYLGNKIGSTDAYGNEMRYVYDALGRLIEVISPNVLDEEGLPIAISERKEYDLLSHAKTMIDGRGFATHQENTIRGKPFRISHPDGTEELFTYNLDGTLHKHVDKDSSYTLYSYDYQLRPIKEQLYDSSNQLISEKRCRYNAFQLVTETDTQGKKTHYKYDAAGRVIEVSKEGSRIAHEYDSLGREHKKIEWDGLDSTSSIKLYDFMDRVIEERVEDAEGIILSKQTYVYDCEGQRTTVVRHIDGVKAVERTYYDSRHKPYKIVDAAGNITHIVHKYDYRNAFGQIVPYTETTDPEGNITIVIKDAMERVQMVQRKNQASDLTQQQEMFYDRAGNKVRQIEYAIQEGKPEIGLIYGFAYDSMNRLIATHEAVKRKLEKSTFIRYDKAGRKKTIVKPDGVKLSHAYDSHGRLCTLRSSDGSISYRYEYDPNGNILSARDSIEGSVSTMEYDDRNRLISETLANGLQLQHRYDDSNKPLEITLPDNSAIGFSYQGSRLTEVSRLAQNREKLYCHTYDQFDATENVLEMTMIGQAGKTTYTYDIQGHTTAIASSKRGESVQYSPNGQILMKTVTEKNESSVSRYAYDTLSQLVEETSDKSHTYRYDALHNRIEKDGNQYRLNALNGLSSDKVRKYVYDSNGNTVEIIEQDKVTKFRYDALDRLTAVISDTDDITYTYDYLHRRTSKTHYTLNAETKLWSEKSSIRFLYIGKSEIGSYSPDDDLCLELRVLGNGKGAEIGAAVAIEILGKTYAPLHDHIGNVVILLDPESGEKVESYNYSAYGEHTFKDSDGKPLERALSPWLFSSKRFDYESGFVFFGRRYYMPESGRWLTPDPIGIAGGSNLYAFVLNNPLNRIDLHGLYPWMADIGNAFMTGISYVASALTIPGQIIQNVGYHMVPIPLVRDVVQIAGKALSFQSFKNHEWGWNKSFWEDLGIPDTPGHRVLLNNGILNSSYELEERPWEQSKAMGGCNVHNFYKASNGLVPDLLESLAQKLGIKTASGELFSQGVERHAREVKYEDPNGRLTIVSHSQGGIMTNNLQYQACTRNLTSCMDVLTFGTGKLIMNSTFNSAVNYVSSMDGVPLCDPMGLARAFFRPTKEVVFLRSKGFPFIDHCYDNDAYKDKRDHIFSKMRKGL